MDVGGEKWAARPGGRRRGAFNAGCQRYILRLHNIGARDIEVAWDSILKYLEKLMKRCCPNILEIAGTTIGAKLILIASGLKRLSGFPASTVQLLGAEKALFRHMTNKKFRPPKYGVIMQHQFIQSAKKQDKGKIARLLADKLSIAAKVDYFKGKFIGDKLKKEIKMRLNS